VRVRSDVERKRLAGLRADARGGNAFGAGLYAPEMTARTYARLHEVAGIVLGAGFPVVVDAAMLQRGERDALRAHADRLGVRCECIWCEAPWPTLQARVARRQTQARDASDATVAVLRRQREFAELPADGERVLRVDTGVSRRRLDAEVAALAAWLRRSR
jgi:hypothetical protein